MHLDWLSGSVTIVQSVSAIHRSLPPLSFPLFSLLLCSLCLASSRTLVTPVMGSLWGCVCVLCVCAGAWRSEVNFSSSAAVHLVFETGSCSGIWDSAIRLCWPLGPRASLICSSPVLTLLLHAAAVRFLYSFWGSKSGPHAYVASILLTEPSPGFL